MFSYWCVKNAGNGWIAWGCWDYHLHDSMEHSLIPYQAPDVGPRCLGVSHLLFGARAETRARGEGLCEQQSQSDQRPRAQLKATSDHSLTLSKITKPWLINLRGPLK